MSIAYGKHSRNELLYIEKKILRDMAALIIAHTDTIARQPSSKFLLPIANSVHELQEIARKLEVLSE